MKRVVINKYQRGIVYRNSEFLRILESGIYWFFKNERIDVYQLTDPIITSIEPSLLMKEPDVSDSIQLVEVKEAEICLVYINGLFDRVLNAGQYLFWKSDVSMAFRKYDTSRLEIPADLDRLTIQKHLMPEYVRSLEVQPHEQALLSVDGKYQGLLQPGQYYWFKNPVTVLTVEVDTRYQAADLSGQEILTKDKVALRVNAWAAYRVVDAEKTVLTNQEWEKQWYVLLQLALRSHISAYNFDELLERKELVAEAVQAQMAAAAERMGLELRAFGIRDIILPGDVREIMNKVLIAEKQAQAQVIMRREETASTRSLLNTAKLMEDNPMLWKLKEMEYVEKIAEKISSISVAGSGDLVDQLRKIFVP